jgi:hypothetical protein
MLKRLSVAEGFIVGASATVLLAVAVFASSYFSGATSSADSKTIHGGNGVAVAIVPEGYNVGIDFSDTVAKLDGKSLSGTVSGYGAAWLADAHGQCLNTQCATMERLGLGSYRVSIQWNNGLPVSGAGGNGNGGTAGDQLVDSIRAVGADPVVVVGGRGGSNDMDFTDAEASALVTHYSSGKYAGANAVMHWVVGNEPSNANNGDMSIAAYCEKFKSSAIAMKQANPNIKLAGPAWPYYNIDVIREFLRCAGEYVDVVDYHAYGQSGQGIDDNIRTSAELYEQQSREVRAAINDIVPHRASQISQQVGEYNVSPFATDDATDERFYTGGTTVWNAIATGSILKGGGRAYIFSDQNNPIGMMFQTDAIANVYGRSAGTPQPAYHGIGMFTGEGLFRPFGSAMVRAESANSDIVAYASAGERNIVLVNRNKTAAQTAYIKLSNTVPAMAAVWQTDPARPFDDPALRASIPADGELSYELPPYSVTTFVLR